MLGSLLPSGNLSAGMRNDMSTETETEMGYADCEDTTTPPNVPLCAKYRRSFAYVTVKDRLPVILTQIVDLLVREKEQIIKQYGEEAKEEIKSIIGEFSKLKNELQTNKPLLPLLSNASDIELWNAYFEKKMDEQGHAPYWYESPWLYVECYMYRRIQDVFDLSHSLNTFDPFRKKKELAFLNSLSTVIILSSHMVQVLGTEKENDFAVKKQFLKLLYVNLWGNRCDLSLSAGGEIVLEEDPFQKVIELKEFLLVDNAEQIWNIFASQRGKSSGVLDIVLDNAGYELFTDLCFADFIISFSLASKVRFRCKAYPWYVSDTCIPDFHWILEKLCSSEDPNISVLSHRWCGYLDEGKWTLHADKFWTLPHVYCEMQESDPKLYDDLSTSVLVIFKGDLNYRKLTGDINWEPTKPFFEVLRGFQPTNIAALRTLKADVICGLAKGQAEETVAKNADWLISGNFAVVQLSF